MTWKKAAKCAFIGFCCGVWAIMTYICVSNL